MSLWCDNFSIFLSAVKVKNNCHFLRVCEREFVLMESCSTLVSAAAATAVASDYDGNCGQLDSDVEESHTRLAVVVKHEDEDGKLDRL